MKALTAAALLVLSISLATSAGRAGTKQYELRIYDPTRQVKTEVTSAEVVRSSVRASRGPAGSGILDFALTKPGASRFLSLTRALARRGARLHRNQSFALAIGGRVFSRPFVDYRRFPGGLPGNAGIEVQLPRLAAAQKLAKEIRGG